AASYNIPATAGLWIDNTSVHVLPLAGSPTIRGLLRISAGALDVGVAADQNVAVFSGATVMIEGGAMSVAGRFAVNSSNSTITYSQTGGSLPVVSAGPSSTTFASFDLGIAATAVSISGGSIVLQGTNGAVTGPRDFRNSGPSQSITGGVLQLGNAES